MRHLSGVFIAAALLLVSIVADPAKADTRNFFTDRAVYDLYISGVYKSSVGDWQGALLDFQRAHGIMPQSAEILIRMADAQIHMDRHKEAGKNALRAVQLDSSAADAYLILSKVAFFNAELDLADTYLAKRLKYAPDDLESRMKLGFLREQRGDMEGVVEAFRDYPPNRPGAAAANFHRGVALVRMERYQQARDAFETVLKLRPGNLEAAQYSAILAERLNQPSEAVAAWGRVIEIDPSNSQARRRRIAYLVELGRTKSAQEEMNELISLSPDTDGALRWLLYELAVANEDYALASRTLLDIGRLNPSEATFLQVALLASQAQGETDTVRSALKYAFDAGGRPEVGRVLARLLIQAERDTEVPEILDKVLEAEPRDTDALWLYGLIKSRQGDNEGAVTYLLRLLEEEPDFAPALNFVGYTWAEKGVNLDRAEGMIKRALAIDPDNPEYVDSLGWVYYQKGYYEMARAQLERAYDLWKEEPVIMEHLGDVYRKLGRTKEAGLMYERALKAGRAEGRKDLKKKIEELKAQQ